MKELTEQEKREAVRLLSERNHLWPEIEKVRDRMRRSNCDPSEIAAKVNSLGASKDYDRAGAEIDKLAKKHRRPRPLRNCTCGRQLFVVGDRECSECRGDFGPRIRASRAAS